MSIKIVIAICLLFVGLAAAQRNETEECLEGLRARAREFNSQYENLVDNATQDLLKYTGFNFAPFNREIRRLTAVANDLANTLGLEDAQTTATRAAQVLDRQRNIFDNFITRNSPRLSKIVEAFKSEVDLLNERFNTTMLFDTTACTSV